MIISHHCVIPSLGFCYQNFCHYRCSFWGFRAAEDVLSKKRICSVESQKKDQNEVCSTGTSHVLFVHPASHTRTDLSPSHKRAVAFVVIIRQVTRRVSYDQFNRPFLFSIPNFSCVFQLTHIQIHAQIPNLFYLLVCPPAVCDRDNVICLFPHRNSRLAEQLS